MAVWNADFKRVFPLLEAADLGALEREYLTVLQFTVTLKASVYDPLTLIDHLPNEAIATPSTTTSSGRCRPRFDPSFAAFLALIIYFT